ncbi:MAG: hypothetical protein SFX73_10260 [Kofleriaceae bacterium]|nr:hypothetical protein [Kofleriaceae bacterium]
MHRRCKGLGQLTRGVRSPGRKAAVWAVLAISATAAADPTTRTATDEVPRSGTPTVSAPGFRPSWDLDGTYLWLGPTAAASHVDNEWDSTFGGHLALLRVRERAALGLVGASIGGSLWTERGGGRVWFDGVIGTRLGSRTVGATLGPLLELGELNHPRIGGSVGVWAFLGVTPFVRAGVVQELGGFAEIGVHIALPVFRR